MTRLSCELGRMLLPHPVITVTVYTVGGVDYDGNEIDEPIVFEGKYPDVHAFFTEEKLNEINKIYRDMPDGYIEIECGGYSREVYDANEIVEAIEEMI